MSVTYVQEEAAAARIDSHLYCLEGGGVLGVQQLQCGSMLLLCGFQSISTIRSRCVLLLQGCLKRGLPLSHLAHLISMLHRKGYKNLVNPEGEKGFEIQVSSHIYNIESKVNPSTQRR